ncbi:LysR family transcriptional regulator [Methyloferula stellata]|uniref:LysR family transcriptional regulator n=1 Tax=Methyloferula stellata TaxID=876270 RepID=UPI0003A8DC3D|nr:LysR family transcriptional regulator [Methyloferula stellata]
MLDLRHVEAFLSVISAGSFHGGAKLIGRSQPTLSQQIQKLEAELGAVLIVRSMGGCHLTQAGAAFRPHAHALLQMAGRAVDAVHTGRISLGASGNIGTYLLQEKVARFAALGYALPDVIVAPNPVLAEKLATGEIDLALMEWWNNQPAFTSSIWRREELVIIVAKTHPFASKDEVSAEDLAGQPMIGGENGTGTGRLLRQMIGEVAETFSIVLTLGSTEAVKNAVKAGLGISVVFASAVEAEVAAGHLHALRLKDKTLHKDLFAVHAANVLGSFSPMQVFIKLLAGDPEEAARQAHAVGQSGTMD